MHIARAELARALQRLVDGRCRLLGTHSISREGHVVDIIIIIVGVCSHCKIVLPYYFVVGNTDIGGDVGIGVLRFGQTPPFILRSTAVDFFIRSGRDQFYRL